MQGSARKDVVFGAAGVCPVTVPGPKWKSWFIGSTASVAAVGCCYLVRRLLIQLYRDPRASQQMILVLAVVLTGGLGLHLAALQHDALTATPADAYFTALLYLLKWPLLTVAIFVPLLCHLTPAPALEVGRYLDNHSLLSQQHNAECAFLGIRVFGDVLESKAGNRILDPVANRVLSERFRRMTEVSEGRIKLIGNEIFNIMAAMLDSSEIFHAVSDRDLPLWRPYVSNPGLVSYSEGYKGLNDEAVARGCRVTRILILGARDLANQADVVEVLRWHHSVGIGYAIAVYEELPPIDIPGAGTKLDYGYFYSAAPKLGDLPEAIGTLSSNDGSRLPEMRANFLIPKTEHQIAAATEIYPKIFGSCRLVDTVFLNSHSELIESMRPRIERATSSVLNRTTTEASRGRQSTFPIEIRSADEIASAVGSLVEMRNRRISKMAAGAENIVELRR